MKNYYLAIVLLVVCRLSGAEPYSYELSVNHQQTETDFSEFDSTVVRGTYYWKPVVAKNVPLAEAAFAARVSSVSASYDFRDFDEQQAFIAQPLISNVPNITNVFPGDSGAGAVVLPIEALSPVSLGALTLAGPSDISDDVISGAVHFVSDGGWIGDFEYRRSDEHEASNSNNFIFEQSSESDTLRFGIGKYFGSASTVVLEYQDRSAESRSTRSFLTVPQITMLPSLSIIGPSRTSIDASSKGYSVKAKTLLNQGEYTHKLEAVVGYDKLETEFGFELVGSPSMFPSTNNKSYALRTGFDYTFYPRADLGLSLDYHIVDAEFGEDKSLGLAVEWFATPKVAMRAKYLKTDTTNSFTDSDGFAVGILGRF